MNCFKNKNKIYPERLNSISEINTDINLNFNNKNELYCNGCNSYLKDINKFIICGGCDKYFHCKIAGECIGKNCFQEGIDNEIYRTNYCYQCISIFYGGNKCLCRNCKIK